MRCNKLKWVPVTHSIVDRVDKRIKFGKRVELYAPTSPEEIMKPLGGVRQRAEQGVCIPPRVIAQLTHA